ncbi:AraC family transcriptional regulator [Sulfurirhabdus autotrophica]|nr:AraC family transcriptional regulator [Sulfurirhabdus autotrophica]
MSKTTESFAETTDISSWNDVLSDTLRSMRISGSLLLRDQYAPPWAVAIPDANKLGELLNIKKDVRVVAFHLVERGHCEITLQCGNKVIVEAGEMVICFGGSSHLISQGSIQQSVPVEELMAGGDNVFRPDKNNLARSTSIMCGIFMLHDTHLNPLFAGLPPLLHASVSRVSRIHNLSGVAHLMSQEIERQSFGGGFVVERLLEVLCAEVVRSHFETISPKDASWFNGIKDPIVGRAIKMIHMQPGEKWTVERLARGVAISPSRFTARFTAAIGDSPMAYVTKWRMNVASRLLNGTQQGIGQVATHVGYENLAAFNRAFKKHTGMPPAAWRHAKSLAH